MVGDLKRRILHLKQKLKRFCNKAIADRRRQDYGKRVTEGQEFFRLDDGIRHALSLFDPSFANHAREPKSTIGQ
jgi:hypothetical protein